MKITAQSWGNLTATQHAAHDAMLDGLGFLRSGKASSASAAAEMAGTTLSSMKKYGGSALQREANGRYSVMPADRLLRPIRVISTDGTTESFVRGSRVASTVGRHANAVKRFLDTGETQQLREFEGKRVAGHELETREEVLEEMARRRDLDWVSLYTTWS